MFVGIVGSGLDNFLNGKNGWHTILVLHNFIFIITNGSRDLSKRIRTYLAQSTNFPTTTARYVHMCNAYCQQTTDKTVTAQIVIEFQNDGISKRCLKKMVVCLSVYFLYIFGRHQASQRTTNANTL